MLCLFHAPSVSNRSFCLTTCSFSSFGARSPWRPAVIPKPARAPSIDPSFLASPPEFFLGTWPAFKESIMPTPYRPTAPGFMRYSPLVTLPGTSPPLFLLTKPPLYLAWPSPNSARDAFLANC